MFSFLVSSFCSVFCSLIFLLSVISFSCAESRGDADDEKEYYVKYKELSYDESYWEFESDISAFQPEIERFLKIQSRSHRPASKKLKSIDRDALEFRKKAKEFQQYEESPKFLSGGIFRCTLHW